jgi:hypothetical protein
MRLSGKIVAISGNEADVCLIEEKKVCESCSTCPKKMGVHDVIKVASIKGILIGQEIVLCDTISWFTKNRILLVVSAFVFGIIIAEAIATNIPFGAYRRAIDFTIGGMFAAVIYAISWFKKPKYLFRIEQISEKQT